MICKICGGDCKEKNGNYVCKYCGAVWQTKETTVSSTPVKSVDTGVSVYDKNINGILEIVCPTPTGTFSGSGSLITADGYALTNTHVVTHNNVPFQEIIVRIAGETVNATVVKLGDNLGGLGSGVDLAILKLSRVPANASVVKLGNTDDVRNGEKVYVIGNSRGEGTCITSGIVSDRLRQVSGKTLLMTDCAVNPGNSGGPIFDEDGVAIGTIVSKRIDSEGMNYAIPANTVRQFIESVIKNF